ncbi:VOC family protein [Jannaschia sp. M317]|uniref:VOC family protein n=1 Tax=Jannaschia sp. M317 TaxID=2867011 RepID=UPI0021A4EF06|nr:VOC family protein [Jannaschia sp. M317]UWQ16302.1 VOC family protein [Jannaschia sp. M317]
MISHICLGCADLDRAGAFYRAVLAPLGLVERAVEDDGGPVMFCWHLPGCVAPRLYITTPYDDSAATAGNGTMVALIAPDRAAVDAAHAAGLSMGGSDAGAPGLRPNYAPDYYGAYLRDPDGNKLHLVHRADLLAAR